VKELKKKGWELLECSYDLFLDPCPKIIVVLGGAHKGKYGKKNDEA